MTSLASAYGPEAARAAGPDELTQRELQVASLVADGLTNAEIATTLHVSHWTVATHVAHVLGKLRYRSRAQVAGWYRARPPEVLDESGRLEALRYYQVLDSEPEPAFDRITALAARLLRSPIALISFVDERRQWFKSAHGIAVTQTSREGGFCAAAITCEAPTLIADARQNEYFARHPMVTGPPGIRLYAGAPLTTEDGHNLGTLCVMDTEPRELNEEELAVLADLAGLAMAQLDQRMAGIRLTESERMRREAHRHAVRMEELEKLKSEFLLVASHELRGPLGVIKGYASMINEGALGTLPSPMSTVLPVMASKISEMEQLVNQMLASARLEDVTLPEQRTEFDLGEVVRLAVGSQLTGNRGGPEVRIALPAEPVMVMGGADGAGVIVSNLVANAIKFSPAGGEILCRLRFAGTEAILDVIDRGLGISEIDLPILFSRFGRVVTEETSQIKGTGLGLWICRQLAFRMGGRIDVESRVGMGSTFTFSVPLAQPA